ncbi:MAG: hypothetical protein A2987_05955 [Omnitrophica bacterium RIFCSPLOWO2_01_FULL_45_10]|nr:MAG: hypothetical protein A2987_05955 [Omnitrophica bacterium RIFCSPLOWO2_01_FULL_45_10]
MGRQKILGWPRSSLEGLKKSGECLWDGVIPNFYKGKIRDLLKANTIPKFYRENFGIISPPKRRT